MIVTPCDPAIGECPRSYPRASNGRPQTLFATKKCWSEAFYQGDVANGHDRRVGRCLLANAPAG